MGGKVTDPQGALVPNATVDVTNDDNNVKQTTRTNGQGVWIIGFLNPGHYQFTVSATGFRSETRKSITLQAADDLPSSWPSPVGKRGSTSRRSTPRAR
jgi:hypothetical protein